jgi:hypothetical protein
VFVSQAENTCQIVKGNPARNISDTRNIEYVIKGGRLVNRKALEF